MLSSVHFNCVSIGKVIKSTSILTIILLILLLLIIIIIWSGKCLSVKCLSGKSLVGKLSVGEMSIGDVSEVSLGVVFIGDVSVGEISVGELSGYQGCPMALHRGPYGDVNWTSFGDVIGTSLGLNFPEREASTVPHSNLKQVLYHPVKR